MSEELDLLWMSLQFKFGVVLGLVAWQSVLRLALKFVNERIKLWMENAMPSENEALQRFLGSLPYRLFLFLIDTLLSVKLPEVARKPTGNTDIIRKDPPASDPRSREGWPSKE